MALGDTVVWEVRTDGNSANGGGYSSGGTDRSQQASPHVTFDGATITASNGSASATITLSGHTVLSGDVGNVVNITGGTNFTPGRYRITSVDTGAGTWTLDRICTSAAGAGMIGRMGGALDHLSTLSGVGSGAQVAWVRGGTYSHGSTVTFPTNGTWGGMQLYGYSTTRGDGGRPILRATAGGIVLIRLYYTHGNGVDIANFELDGNSQTNTDGIYTYAYGSGHNAYRNIHAHHCRYGFDFSDNGGACIDCHAYNNTDGWRGYTGGGQMLYRCKAYDNTGIGFNRLQGMYEYCEAYGNGGAGWSFYATGISILQHCHATLNGGHGFDYSDGSNRQTWFINCIASRNTGYGFNQGSALKNFAYYCGTYGNTSGAFSGVSQMEGNVACSADPHVDAVNDDFRLNGTVGGGAALRALGSPSYTDIGTYQHQDAAGGLLIHPGMRGGMRG